MDVFCSKCGTRHDSGVNFCSACGHGINVDSESNIIAIVMMWLLQLVAFISKGVEVLIIAHLFGVLSLGLAIYLVTRKSYADRVNGWLRIGLSLVLGVVFILNLQR